MTELELLAIEVKEARERLEDWFIVVEVEAEPDESQEV